MKKLLRTTLGIFVFTTIYVFIYLVVSLITPKLFMMQFISHIISLLIAVLSVLVVWKKTKHISNNLATHIIVGGLIVEPIGFMLGFFTSIVMTPVSNYGPLAGIFIAAPTGFVIGLLSGWIYWKMMGERYLY